MTKIKKKWLWVCLGIGVSLGVASALFFKLRKTETEDAQSVFSQVPIVEAVQARLGNMQHALRLTGTLRPNDRAVIRSEVDARIKKIHFKEGAFVDKGDILIELDNSRTMSSLNEIKAKLRHAEGEYERAKKLAKEQILSTSECDRRFSEMEALRAQVDFQDVMLRKHNICAPFEGIVGLKEISEGEFINAGKELVLLVDLTPLKIDFRVPEMSLRHVSVGQTIRVCPNEFEQEFFATIIAIDPMGDPSAHSFVARAVLENQSISMRPGGFAEVFVPVAEGEQSILVPESAIERRGDMDIVYRIIDGIVARTPVTTGDRKDGEVEILSGVDEGDYVVTAGHMKVRDNKPVLIQETVLNAKGGTEDASSVSSSSTEEGISQKTQTADDKKENLVQRILNFIKGLFHFNEKRSEEAVQALAASKTQEKRQEPQKEEQSDSGRTEGAAANSKIQKENAHIRTEGKTTTETENSAEGNKKDGFVQRVSNFIKSLFRSNKQNATEATTKGKSAPSETH
ncbi:MAG: efflux RND transporter periplasmic adaptor subunit [Holosporales bacterium]|jgi:membrane fusion protein (multidrug efflux system)|nr:efflux RND transporter periplasmic adaptor subunit [Holosporales bacterium]